MANLTRQQTRYMSRAEFEALDKSTVPAGTEINIVDKIQKEDLSTELLNTIESSSIPGVGIDYGSSSAEGALFIGHYNEPEENAIFQIGIGDSDYRKNILSIVEDPHSQHKMTYNGNASLLGDVIIGTLFVEDAPVDERGVIRVQDLPNYLPSWHATAPEDTSKVQFTRITFNKDIQYKTGFTDTIACSFLSSGPGYAYFEINNSEKLLTGCNNWPVTGSSTAADSAGTTAIVNGVMYYDTDSCIAKYQVLTFGTAGSTTGMFTITDANFQYFY